MGLADVLLDRLPLLVAVYGVTRTIRVTLDNGVEVGLIWLAVSCLALVWRPGLYLVAGFTFVLSQQFVELPVAVHHNGFMLVGWLALAAAVFDGRQLVQAVRALTITVYVFAAANKLSPAFLDGSILADYAPWLPYPELIAPLVVAAEALLGVAVWRRWRLAIPAAVVLHVGIVVSIWGGALIPYPLIDYNAALVLMVWVSVSRPRRVGTLTPPPNRR